MRKIIVLSFITLDGVMQVIEKNNFVPMGEGSEEGVISTGKSAAKTRSQHQPDLYVAIFE